MQQHRPPSLNEQLTKAAENDHNDKLKELITYNSTAKQQFSNIQLEELNINAQDAKGETALNWAACRGNLKGVNLLLDAKALPDIPNKITGWTPLTDAAQKGHEQIVDCLINNRASVDHHNNEGSTALMIAAYFGCTEVVDRLIKSQAKLDLRNNHGLTALDCAIQGKQLPVVVLLLQAKAPIDNLGALFNFLKSCDQANPEHASCFAAYLRYPGLEGDAVAEVQIYYDKLIASSVNEACQKKI